MMIRLGVVGWKILSDVLYGTELNIFAESVVYFHNII